MAVRRFVAAGFALLVASSASLVRAQATSNVTTCVAGDEWMINTKSQTPCLQSAYLSAQCNGGQWNVPGIGTEGPYNHPNGDGANKCRCNMVVYNLLSACSICQGGPAGNWANWISNCSAANTSVGYPLPIPAGVAISSWAYLDFTQQDVFQPDVARQYATSATASPESMSSPGQTQAQTTPAGSSAATGSRTTSNPGATTLPTPAPSSGAIVGGVVGGVLGLAVLALIAWLLIRKKNQQTQTPPSEKFAAPGNGPYDGGYPVQQPYNAGHYTPVPVSQGGAYNHPGHVQPYGAPDTPGAGFKPYDPSDPSTFPATPGPGAPTIHSQGATEYSNHPRPGQYNYAAEL